MSNPAEQCQLTTAELVEWSECMDAAGKRDAIGYPFTSWLVAVHTEDGKAKRNADGRQIFETQAEWKARQQPRAVPIGETLSLF